MANVDDGKLRIADRLKLNKILDQYNGSQVVVTIRPPKAIRSSSANRYYWGIVVKVIADNTGNDSIEVHEYMKSLFLKRQLKLVDAQGEVISQTEGSLSTTSLSTADFYEYIECIRRFAAEELHLTIPDPDGNADIQWIEDDE